MNVGVGVWGLRDNPYPKKAFLQKSGLCPSQECYSQMHAANRTKPTASITSVHRPFGSVDIWVCLL